ncbi:ribulose-bisphosphate carboxylase large subunit family protein [Paenibacillus sp. 598K]|uniref:ribulose-bisphosphate carboxylase large subunit family protein n=1 Tax=Paenibacillus sp. 598K TaxID=1117987 RepID=UPI000FFF15E6|nr:ribulose-bisphosphate carboxylase large subunit family protein [Paenibacillus sp. 598K]
MATDRITVTYYIESPYELRHAAEVLAGEQSTGTFLAIPGETDEIKARHRATIDAIRELGTAAEPALPGSAPPAGFDGAYRRGEIDITFPYDNIGPSLPNLMAVIAGNLFELQELSAIRLTGLQLPAGFHDKYQGPRFGIRGTRDLLGVYDRPVIGTIVKPNIGLTADGLRPIVRDLALAGIDFIKDDEVNGNPPYFPLAQRIEAVMDEINRAAERTGKKTMYAFNITGDIDEMKRGHDQVLEAGGTCVMVSINSIGWSGLAHLRSYCELPIHGHRNQWGMWTRHPGLGMSFSVYQQLCRLAGVDHLHTNGLNNKFSETNESVIQSVTECLTPIFGEDTVFPVLSSKQWAGQAVESYRTFGTIDLMNIAGGGIHAHPGGYAAGFRSMVQGWEAALAGIDLDTYAADHPELRDAIAAFAGRPS